MADLIASSEGSKQKIQMGSRISLHFALLMPGGEEIDPTRRGKPAALTLGDVWTLLTRTDSWPWRIYLGM